MEPIGKTPILNLFPGISRQKILKSFILCQSAMHGTNTYTRIYQHNSMGKDLHGAYNLGVNIGIGTVFASLEINNAYSHISEGQRYGKRLCTMGILSPASFKELEGVEDLNNTQDLFRWFREYAGVLADGIPEGKFRDLYHLGYHLGMAETQALQGSIAADQIKKQDLANARQFADKLRDTCCPGLKREDLSEYLNHDQIKFIRTGWAYYLEWQIK
jgi:hypothetical protein